MPVAYSYVRFSTSDQAMGDSERRQLDLARAWAARKRIPLDESLKPDRGRSGYHGHHRSKGHLGRFLALVEAGQVPAGSILVVENCDRLSREGAVKVIREILGKLWDHGVTLQTLAPEETYPPGCDNDPRFIALFIYLQRAHDESKRKGERIAAKWANWRARVEAGEKAPPPGTLPGWLRWSGEGFELEPEPTAAVRLIYRWAGEGLGVNRIVERLNDPNDPVPVIGRKGAWRLSYVSKLLAGRAVLGELRYVGPDGKERTVEGFFPAAVDYDTWAKARAAVSARKIACPGGSSPGVGPDGHEVANLLTGLVRDAFDGELMHITWKQLSATTFRRSLVSCGGQRRQGGRTPVLSVPYGVVEAAVLRMVKELKPEDLLGRNAGGDASRLAVLEGTVADLKGRIAKAKAKADAGGDDLEDLFDLLAGWRGKLKEAEKAREELKAKLAASASDALGATQSLLPVMRSASGQERADLRAKVKAKLGQVIERIDMLSWDPDRATRAAELHVTLAGGKVRSILLVWARAGLYPSACTGISGLVGGPKSGNLDGKRLSEYATDPAVREWWDAHTTTLGPALVKALREEVEQRLRMKAAGDGSLERYLASAECLDGAPPPSGRGRPRGTRVTEEAGRRLLENAGFKGISSGNGGPTPAP